MAAFLSKYGVARHLYVPMVKRAVVDFAVSADWTPAAGDVKISKDGGAAANVTNLPTAITMGNTAMWDFSLTATEMQAAQILVTVADAATKVVEDQMLEIETYGNASAQHAFDLGTATVVASSVSALAAGVITAASINTDTGLKIRTGTATAGGASTITLDAGASATNNLYAGMAVVITGGTGAGQHRVIQSYVGATKVATMSQAWTTNPDNTSTFALIPARTLTDLMAADVANASALATDAVTEIVTAVWATAMSDISGVPAITGSALAALNWLFALSRNRRTQTSSTETLYKDDGSTVLSTSAKSDDGTTFERAEYA